MRLRSRTRAGWRRVFVAILLGIVAPRRVAGAQDYYNLDGGRPNRIEDATPTERYELEIQLLPVRFERFVNGMTRWRTDPKLSFGIAPFTEVELRLPVLRVDTRRVGGQSTTGVGGLAIGALHAVTLETGGVPALALAGEWIAPVGGLAAPVGSYSAKLVGTKTLAHLRVHLNAGYGTWSVRPPPPVGPTCPSVIAAGTVVPPGCGGGIPIVPDTPCDRVSEGASLACIGRAAVLGASPAIEAAATSAPTVGYRWMSGLAVDRAFPLASTLVSADVVAERFIGLYDAIDWSAELGMRHQWTPTLVVDFGAARHFTGPAVSTAVTVGLTYAAPQQWRVRRSAP